MNPQTTNPSETANRRTLKSRLGRFAIALATLTAFVIAVVTVFPKPISWEIYRANGMVNGRFGSLIPDHSVTSVWLINTNITDKWLSRLARCANLEMMYVDAGAIGPSLKDLRQLSKLKHVQINGSHTMQRLYDEYTKTSNRQAGPYIDVVNSTLNCEELLSLPQLEFLVLNQFKNKIYNAGRLKEHPTLKRLSFDDFEQLAEVLDQIAECRNVESIAIVKMDSGDERLLTILERFDHLKELHLPSSILTEEFTSRLTTALPSTSIDKLPNYNISKSN